MRPDKLGKLIRFVRKRKGISLEELADANLSISTLSRIENGKGGIEKVKVVLEKLGIRDEEIPDLLQEMQREDEIDQFFFRACEAQVRQDILSPLELNEKLAKIQLPAAGKYLKAKRFFIRGNYKSACKLYHEIIRANEENCCPKSNLKAAAYLDLSVIAWRQNRYADALKYIEEGLQVFDHSGTRRNVFHALCYNKAFILEQLGKHEEADKALAPAWEERAKIEDIRTKIQVYQLKASLKRYKKKYSEATRILAKALDIANSNDDADGAFYVLVDLGKLAIGRGLTHHGELSLRAAIALAPKLQRTRATTAYLELGKLYFDQKRIEEAKTAIREAVKIAQRHKNIYQLIKCFIILGNIYEEEENRLEARSYYKRSLKLADKYGFDQFKPELYDALFRVGN